MVFRSFDRFLASAYCEGLLSLNRFVPFTEFRKRLDSAEPVSWLALLDTISAALRPTSVHVWRYEDLEGHVDEVLRRAAFDVPIRSARILALERASYSQVAMAFLEHANRVFGPERTAELFDGLEAIAPKGAGFAPFRPWGEAEARELAARYAAEVARIPESMWLLTPGVASPAAGQVGA